MATIILLLTSNLHASAILKSNIRTNLLSMPMGIDYVVVGFDMEVQPLVTHNAA